MQINIALHLLRICLFG